MNETKQIADYLSKLTFEQLNAHTVRMAKFCILDWMGIAIRGSKEKSTTILRNVVFKNHADEATILGTNERAVAREAAFCNSAASHSLDFDDLHNPSIIHPACVVVAPAFSMAEKLHSTGKDLITAVTAGYECSGRVGESVLPESYFYWHTTGTAGIFGGAAAVANLMKLNAHDTLMCFGSAGTQAAGLWEFLKEGTMSKILHTGKSSYGAILAAELAKGGFTAASQILEGEKGFCRAMVNPPHLEKLTEGLGNGKFKIDVNSFKPYACCKHSHAAIYAVQVLAKENNLTPENVKKITLHVNEITNYLINNADPQTAYGCKFSIQYCVAAMLKFGKVGIEQFAPELMNNTELREIMKKIEVMFDKDVDAIIKSDPSKLASIVEIETTDAKKLEKEVDYPKGDPDNAFTWEEAVAKFKGLAEPVYGEQVCNQLVNLIDKLEEVTDFDKELRQALKK